MDEGLSSGKALALRLRLEMIIGSIGPQFSILNEGINANGNYVSLSERRTWELEREIWGKT